MTPISCSQGEDMRERVSDKKVQVDIWDKKGSFYRNETSPKGQSHLETTSEQ